MYAKVYWIGCDPSHAEELLGYYDSELTPAIEASEHHVGHHMVEAGNGKWLLVSNYHNEAAAEAAVPMVQDLVKPMMQQFGMTLEAITEGQVVRSI